MIAIFDVDYKDDQANAACVVANSWVAKEPLRSYAKGIEGIAAYEPGAFYKRELPCLLSLIEDITEPIDYYVIDGYVWLGDKPGLGAYLYHATGEKIPVIGVAKTKFHANFKAQALIRGQSKNPIFITSAGIDVADSTNLVSTMDGENRLPTLLKLVDQLCRQW